MDREFSKISIIQKTVVGYPKYMMERTANPINHRGDYSWIDNISK